MIRKLLILMAGGAILSVACFTALNLMGGFHRLWFEGGGPPWADPGPPATRALAWQGGQRLEIHYPAEIVYTQGPQPSFTATGPKALVDSLTLENGELRSTEEREFRWGRHRHRGRLRLQIVSPDTREFHLAGAEKLELNNFDQDELVLHSAGAADVEGRGKARRLEIRISGAGHFDLENLPVDEADVAISGAGDADLDARTRADIAISGAGHVQLKSRPPNLTTHISGFGSIETPEGRVK